MPNDNSHSEQEVPAWRKRDRKRGIITKDDRSFLSEGLSDKPPGGPDKQTIRDKRYRIRERIKNSLLDFNYLINIPEDDREKVFKYLVDEGGPTLHNVFEFLYLGITDLGEDTDDGLELEALVWVLERAIIEAERRERNYIADVTVKIDIERTRPDPETLLEKMLEGRGSLNDFLYYFENEGDKYEIFQTVAEQKEPLVVSAGSDDEKMEILTVEEAREVLKRETEVLDEEDVEPS